MQIKKRNHRTARKACRSRPSRMRKSHSRRRNMHHKPIRGGTFNRSINVNVFDRNHPNVTRLFTAEIPMKNASVADVNDFIIFHPFNTHRNQILNGTYSITDMGNDNYNIIENDS